MDSDNLSYTPYFSPTSHECWVYECVPPCCVREFFLPFVITRWFHMFMTQVHVLKWLFEAPKESRCGFTVSWVIIWFMRWLRASAFLFPCPLCFLLGKLLCPPRESFCHPGCKGTTNSTQAGKDLSHCCHWSFPGMTSMDEGKATLVEEAGSAMGCILKTHGSRKELSFWEGLQWNQLLWEGDWDFLSGHAFLAIVHSLYPGTVGCLSEFLLCCVNTNSC